MKEYCLIFWTAKDKQEAQKIASELLNKKWVACVSIFPEIESYFLWKGKINQEKEVKVIFKTKSEYFSQISSWIQAHASYEISEILQVPIEEGNPSYLSWLKESLF